MTEEFMTIDMEGVRILTLLLNGEKLSIYNNGDSVYITCSLENTKLNVACKFLKHIFNARRDELISCLFGETKCE